MHRTMLGWTAAAVLCSAAGCTPPTELPAQGQDRPTTRPSPTAPLTRTVVTPFLDRDMPPGRNVLWCATFQMVWDQLADRTGGKVTLRPPHPTAASLNLESLAENDLPAGGVVRAAGLIRDGIGRRILAELTRVNPKFSRKALPDLSGLPDDALVLYAYLYKSLPFRTAFSVAPAGLTFRPHNARGSDSVTVEAFSVPPAGHANPARKVQARQVRILYHRFGPRYDRPEQAQFIIELLTRSRSDRIILACIPPARTLGETVNSVLARVKRPNTKTASDGRAPELLRFSRRQTPPDERKRLLEQISAYACLLADDDVIVPRIRLEATKQFDELTGRRIHCPGRRLDGQPIAAAVQWVRFALDRRGAELEGSAYMATWGDIPPVVRQFDFWRPFLVLLMRKGAARPYLALWVANDELLVRCPDDEEDDE